MHFANLGLPQSDIDSSRSAQRRRSQMNEQSLSDCPLQNPGTEVHFTLGHLPESPTECTVLCFFERNVLCSDDYCIRPEPILPLSEAEC